MSYILDALRKVEYEKNRKKLSDGRVSISGDLFQENRQPVGKPGVWMVAAIISVAALLVCAVTWFALQEKTTAALSVAKQPLPAPATSVTSSVTDTRPVLPIAPVASNISKVIAGKESSEQVDKGSASPVKPVVAGKGQAVLTIAAPVDIKLSGIAWQDDRAGRRAVINGFLLKEGSVVSGAKITDIKADKVVFSSASGVFEVKLDSAMPVEGRQ